MSFAAYMKGCRTVEAGHLGNDVSESNARFNHGVEISFGAKRRQQLTVAAYERREEGIEADVVAHCKGHVSGHSAD